MYACILFEDDRAPMYVCMHVCILFEDQALMYVCMYVRMHVFSLEMIKLPCLYVCMYVCILFEDDQAPTWIVQRGTPI